MTTKSWDAPRKYKLLLTAAYCVDFVCLGLATGLLGPTLPALCENIGIEKREAGVIFTFRATGWMLGSFVGAKLFEKHGGWKYVWFSLFFSSITCCLIPFVTWYWPMLFTMAISAFILSWTEIGCSVLLTKVWQKDVNPYMQLLHFSYGVGASSSPFIAGLIYKIVPWHQRLIWSWVAMGVLLTVGVIPQIIMKEPGIDAWDDEGSDSSSDSEKISKNSFGKGAWLIVGLSATFLLLYVGSEQAYGGWVSTFGVSQYNLEESVAAWLSSVFWAAITVGRLMGVWIATIATPWQMLWGDMIGTLIGFMFLLLFPSSIAVLWISTIIIGLSMATMFATAYALPLQMNIPLTSRAATLLTVGGCIGDMGIPALVGVAMATFGNKVMVYAVGVVFLPSLPLAIVMWFLGNRRTKEIELQGESWTKLETMESSE